MTFVDTWKQFHPLDAEYVVLEGEAGDIDPQKRIPPKLVPIAPELILEAYKLVRSNVRGDFRGIFQCLPHSWYIWEEEFEDEIRKQSIMIFENQVEGFLRLDNDYKDPSSIPDEISESLGRDLVRRYFGDCQDPLPRWFEIKSLLEARGAWCPSVPSRSRRRNLSTRSSWPRRSGRTISGSDAKEIKLTELFNENSVCRMVYRNDLRSFFEDVDRELASLRERVLPTGPKYWTSCPPRLPRPWPEGRIRT